jgi:hypothetical protein
MAAILRNLPFRKEQDEVVLGQERVPIKAYQIIAWFSLTARNVIELPPQAPRFPAIVDIGHNHNFSIQQRHLIDWAALPAERLPAIGQIRQGDRFLRLCAANVWIHPNVPGQRDQLSLDPPLLLTLDQGIAIYPSELAFPRVPLFGLRGLDRNKLHLIVDAERCLVNLYTPDLRTKLMRWLG